LKGFVFDIKHMFVVSFEIFYQTQEFRHKRLLKCLLHWISITSKVTKGYLISQVL